MIDRCIDRGRAFWHGWRNRMIDLGELLLDETSRLLAHEVVAAERAQKKSAGSDP